MASLKSPVAAASPEVYASTPSISPTVLGTMSSRRASTAFVESASVPSPTVGSVTMATDLSELSSMLGLPSKRAGRAEASDSRALMPDATFGEVASSALTTTIAALPSLGKAAWIRS
jgi:hypothetical protein